MYGFYGFYLNSISRHDTNNGSSNTQTAYSGWVNGTDQLIYYDPSSGENTTVGTISTSAVTSDDLKCFDSVNNILYTLVVSQENTTDFDHQPLGLLGFNLSNPSITHFIQLPMLMTCDNCIGATDLCVADPTTGDLLSV